MGHFLMGVFHHMATKGQSKDRQLLIVKDTKLEQKVIKHIICHYLWALTTGSALCIWWGDCDQKGHLSNSSMQTAGRGK